MAAEFVCKIGVGPGSRDYPLLSSWYRACRCDLTSPATKVFSSTKYTGTQTGVEDGKHVHLYRGGVRLDCQGTSLHSTDSQTLVRSIRGADTPQAGDQWRRSSGNSYGWVVIHDGGDSAIAVASCYKDREMNDRVSFEGWTTNPVNRLIIRTPLTERHTGKTNTGFILFDYGVHALLDIDNDVDLLVQGLELRGAGVLIFGPGNGEHTLEIDSCILHDNGWGPAVNIPGNPGLTTKIWNCLFYNTRDAAIGGNCGGRIYVENCSIFNPGGYGVYRAQCYNVVVHRGNLPKGYTCFGPGCTGDYNCDGLEAGVDGSAPGAHSLHNKKLSSIKWTDPYDDPPISYSDFSVYSDSILVGGGVDRSLGDIGFNTDITGSVRSLPWTIGSHQSFYLSSSSSESFSSSSSSSSSGVPSDRYLKLRDYVY